jgi:methylenetetrahydrofolate dehydrogenase (NADP+)/methenyltetrahydrofolate cyclohydrolase
MVARIIFLIIHMTGQIIDGLAVATDARSRMKQDVGEPKKRHDIIPCLATVLVGDNPASYTYIKNKQKAAAAVGIITRDHKLSSSYKQDELMELINLLNQDIYVHGILVQLPLPAHIDELAIVDLINPAKDVDGLTPFNAGMLLNGKGNLKPCTPSGIIELLDYYKIDISRMDAVIVNRSNLVGKPLALLLLERNATVTICHSKTKGLDEKLKGADLIVTAVGDRQHFILTEDMVRNDAVVIDVGITKDKGKLMGDVDFQAVKEKVSWITPVPGGVGPMTISMLLKNTISAAFATMSKKG